MVDFIELPIDPMEMAEDTPFLAHYFPNIFAKALVPLNPRRWPAFAAGSAMAAICQNLAIKSKHHLTI